MFLKNLTGLARFSAERMGKVDLARGETLFAGLNCFEPGQEHSAHTHAGQDKLYVIVTGDAEVRIGEESAMLTQGDAALAPAGVVHSIRNMGVTRLVVLAALAPPPK
jgi:mannose-6-phosphate isomerase-like protein (cupin superfamily)